MYTVTIIDRNGRDLGEPTGRAHLERELEKFGGHTLVVHTDSLFYQRNDGRQVSQLLANDPIHIGGAYEGKKWYALLTKSLGTGKVVLK